jgi:hypothetical protein
VTVYVYIEIFWSNTCALLSWSAFTHVRLRPDQLLLTAVEFLGEFYLDGDGRLVVNRDGKVRLYAVLFSPFGGVNSPPCFLDLSLALARCCVLQEYESEHLGWLKGTRLPLLTSELR